MSAPIVVLCRPFQGQLLGFRTDAAKVKMPPGVEVLAAGFSWAWLQRVAKNLSFGKCTYTDTRRESGRKLAEVCRIYYIEESQDVHD